MFDLSKSGLATKAYTKMLVELFNTMDTSKAQYTKNSRGQNSTVYAISDNYHEYYEYDYYYYDSDYDDYYYEYYEYDYYYRHYYDDDYYYDDDDY